MNQKIGIYEELTTALLGLGAQVYILTEHTVNLGDSK